jgi:hypothetical protein
MSSSDLILEMKQSLIPVMYCLQPSWREENMDDDGYWDDEIISKEEYFRIKEWWITSGSFDKLCLAFIDSFKAHFPEISTIGKDFLPNQDEWVTWIFEFFEWWPNDFSEFAERIIEGTWIGELSYEYLTKCTNEWWNSTAPIHVLESALKLTSDVKVLMKDLK